MDEFGLDELKKIRVLLDSVDDIFILRIIIPYIFEFEGIFLGLIVLNPAFSYQTFYPKIMHILHYIPFKSILCIRFVDL